METLFIYNEKWPLESQFHQYKFSNLCFHCYQLLQTLKKLKNFKKQNKKTNKPLCLFFFLGGIMQLFGVLQQSPSRSFRGLLGWLIVKHQASVHQNFLMPIHQSLPQAQATQAMAQLSCVYFPPLLRRLKKLMD